MPVSLRPLQTRVPLLGEANLTVHLSALPEVAASCSDSGIGFTLEHRPFDYLWQIAIGSEPLSSELASRHGYVVSNDSQSLQLFVPLFTAGYVYNVRN